MKTLSVVLFIAGLALSACTATSGALGTSTPAVPQSTEPPVLATPTHIPVDLNAPQRAAIASLAQSLGVPIEQVKLVSSEAVTWPNGCLGIQRLGVMCTQNQVPGFKLVLSANGKQYEYHTNLDGTVIAPAEAMQAPGPAEQAAIKQLAHNLGVAGSEIKLVSSAPVEWPDSCLGVAMERVMCAQMVTPGYLIVLEAGGRQYEYHTNGDASQIVPAIPALDWKQEGGIAGLCQNLTVFPSGEIYAMDCRAGGDGRMAVLTVAQRTQLYAWMDKLTTSTIDLSDPQGAADAMTRSADLFGHGTQPASDSDKHAIFDFGKALYTQVFP
ncbi:MAG: hypothetical protein ACM3MF_09905 [Anaerolineae bacterium]